MCPLFCAYVLAHFSPSAGLPSGGAMAYQMMFNNPFITPSKLFQLLRGETDWGKQRESTPETGRSCVEEESHQHGAHWSNRGLVWFQIPGTTRAKLFLSGWISFLLSQVIQSVAVDVIVLVSSVGRERVDEGKSLARGPATGTRC